MTTARRAAAAALSTLLLAGCTASPIGESLGEVAYVVDQKPQPAPSTWVYTSADIADLTSLVAGLGSTEFADRLADVDPKTHVVVSLYYDACSKSEPELVLDGSTLTVRYRATTTRNCARAVDTLALFAAPRSSLPDPVTLQVCKQVITVAGDTVTGEPIGLC